MNAMLPDDFKKVMKMFSGMAELYQRPAYSDGALKMIGSMLGDLPFEKVMMAIETWCKTGKYNRPPTPAEIREIINPKEGDKDNARFIAAKIMGCIARHGYSWSMGIYRSGETRFEGTAGKIYNTFHEALISEVGEVGFEAIKTIGGWLTLCERDKTDDTAVMQSQLRDLCEAVLIKSKNGTLNKHMELPTGSTQSITGDRVPENIKSILPRKDLE